MATFTIKALDGYTYTIQAPDNWTNEQAYAAMLAQYPDAAKPAPDKSGFVPAVKSGISDLQGNLALVGGKLGILSTQEAEEAYKRRKAESEAAFSPTEKGWSEAPWLKFKETLGGSLPAMAAPLAVGAAAASAPVIGTVGPVAAGVLGTLGAFGASTAQTTGSHLARQMETGKTLKEASGTKALAAAIPSAALDTLSLKMMPFAGKLLGAAGEEVTVESAKRLAEQTAKQIAMDYVKSTGKAMAVESTTEVAQQALERLQAGLSLTDPEARKEYIDNAIGGGVLGMSFAIPGRHLERRGIKATGEKLAQEEQERQAEQQAPQGAQATAPVANTPQAKALQEIAARRRVAPLDEAVVPEAAPTVMPLEAVQPEAKESGAIPEPTLRGKPAKAEAVPATFPPLEPSPAAEPAVTAAASMRHPLADRVIDELGADPTLDKFVTSTSGKRFLTRLDEATPENLADTKFRKKVTSSRLGDEDVRQAILDKLFPLERPTQETPVKTTAAEPSATAPVQEELTRNPKFAHLSDEELAALQDKLDAAMAPHNEVLAKGRRGEANKQNYAEASKQLADLSDQMWALGRELRARREQAPLETATREAAPKVAESEQLTLAPEAVTEKPETIAEEDADPAAKAWDTDWAYEDNEPKFNQLSPRAQRRVRSLISSGEMTEDIASSIRGDNTVAFNRTVATGPALPKEHVASIVDAVTSKWANAPEMKVVEDINSPDVPQAVRDYEAQQKQKGAVGEPEGFWYGGTAYITSAQMRTPSDVMRVLFHEALGHYGLRGTFGESLTPILKQIVNARRAEVEAKAREYGLDPRNEAHMLQAAEDVLCNIAQTKPELGFVRRAVAAVRSWLQKNVPLTRNMKLTDDQIIHDYILPAREFVVNNAPSVAKARTSDLQPALSRQGGDNATPPSFDDITRRSKGKEYQHPTVSAVATEAVNNATKAIATRKDGVGLVDVVRNKIADNKAVVTSKLNEELYHSLPTDLLGQATGEVRARQADDVNKYMLAAFREGVLAVNPVTKSLEVRKLKYAADDAIPLIKQWGESKGRTFEQAKADIDVILEALRTNELIKSNATGETDIGISMRTENMGIDYRAIKAAVDEYNSSPFIKQIYECLDTPRKALLEELYKSGRLTAEDTKALRDAPFYIPFDRVGMEDQAKAFRSAKKTGKSGYSSLMKIPELKGSDVLQVGSPLENYYRTMTWLSTELAKQNAATGLAEGLEALNLAVRIPETKVPSTPYYIRVYEKGEPVYMSVPSKEYMTPFIDKQNPVWAITPMLSKIANIKRLSITANPGFALGQVLMDVQGALVFADVHSPVRFIKESFTNFGVMSAGEIKNAVRAVLNKPPVPIKMEEEMSRIGLAGEIDYNLRDPAMDALVNAGLRRRTLFGSTTLGAVAHGLQQISHASDIAVRKALYDDSMRHKNDPILASVKARELINFRRSGSSEIMKNLAPMVPFLNAYVQANDVIYRAVIGKGNIMGRPAVEARKRLLGAVSIYAGLAFVYAMSKMDDDDEDTVHRSLASHVRNNNWVFSDGVKIPVRPDMGFLKAGIENAVEWYTRQGKPDEIEGKQAVKNAMIALWEAYSFGVPIPAALAPLFEIMTNWSSFTGRQLVGTYQGKLDKSQQSTSDTSEAAKSVAQWLQETTGVEVSPVHIDHALKGYFGTVASTVMAATDSIINPDKVDRPLHKMIGLGTLTWDETQRTGSMDEFYDLSNELDKRKATYDRLLKTDAGAAEKYAQTHENELAAASYTHSILVELGKIRQQITILKSKNGVEAIPDKAERENAIKELEAYNREMTSGVRQIRKDYGL